MTISAEQLRAWADDIRKAAVVLYPPGEFATADQGLAALDADATLADPTKAGDPRRVAAENLRKIADSLASHADTWEARDMAWTFRRSVKIGPLRFTLGKSRTVRPLPGEYDTEVVHDKDADAD